MALFNLFVLCATLVLEFDGSLRRAPDPNNEIVPKSLSSKLAPFAACACAIHEGDDSETGEIILLGGKEIPYYGQSQTTSADVEYEGLILGLKGLLNVCEDCVRDEDTLKSPIIVRGDCKTVIDQMNGNSLPRKQKAYCNEAILIVEQIKQAYDVDLQFEHINREYNELCDVMCKIIIERLQQNAISELMNSLINIEQEYVEIPLPGNKKKRLKSQKSPFLDPLKAISDWHGHIPISIRPYLLCEFYHASNRMKDYVGMRMIGDVMKSEAKRWEKQGIGHASILRELESLGWQLTYNSLKHMGLEKEAEVESKSQNTSIGQIELAKVSQLLQEKMPKCAIQAGSFQITCTSEDLKAWHEYIFSTDGQTSSEDAFWIISNKEKRPLKWRENLFSSD